MAHINWKGENKTNSKKGGKWRQLSNTGEGGPSGLVGLRVIFPYMWKITQSCPTLGYVWPHGLYSPWNSPGQNTGVGSLSLLQGIFPTQGSNPGLLLCRRILYHLSHQGSPKILEWGVYPFSSRSSQPRNQTGVFCIAGRFFTSWASREALGKCWLRGDGDDVQSVCHH